MTPGAQSIESVITGFIASAGRPAVLDPGEEPLPLVEGQWSLSQWNGRVVLEAWDAKRNLVRRISGLGERRSDRLSLKVERFPKMLAELQIADLDAPLGLELHRRTSRIAFRDRFRLLLAREFPAWRLADLSAEPNLEASLSPAWVRAFLRQGSTGIAVIAAPPLTAACEDAVAFGLIWLDYLRRREPDVLIRHLLIFVPSGHHKETALRVAHLNSAVAEFQVHIYDERERAARLDLEDVGNADSHLPPCVRSVGRGLSEPGIAGLPIERVPLSDGVISLRVRGLEFARAAGAKLTCGIGRRKRSDARTVSAFAREVARVRCADSEDPQHPFYLSNPESWLESAIRQSPELLDASLEGAPVYGQVPAFRSAERGVIDLLSVDYTGRLVVIEIKASTSIPLPFQALDYWLRVKKHLEAGDFGRLGYFPGITRSDPRLRVSSSPRQLRSFTPRRKFFLRASIRILKCYGLVSLRTGGKSWK